MTDHCMASKFTPQGTNRNEKSRILLPCISEDELLDRSAPSSQGSMPKSSSKRRLNSEPSVPNTYEVKDSSVKSEDATDDSGKGKVPSNHKKVTRRGSVPVGVSKEKDSTQCSTKTTRGSKNTKQQVKLNAPSPDVIDLSDEDVVHGLMIRLYETLRVSDSNNDNSSLTKQNDGKVVGSCIQSKPTDNAMKLFRHHTTRFPQVSKTTEVFYSKPASWKSLMTSRQLQSSKRTKHFLAFQERSTKADQPVKEKMLQKNDSYLTWPFKSNCAHAGRSTSVVRTTRGLSVPFIVTNGSAFVSSEMFKTSFELRKSVSFVE